MLISRQRTTACINHENFGIFRAKKYHLSHNLMQLHVKMKGHSLLLKFFMDFFLRIFYYLKESKEVLRLRTNLISKFINGDAPGINLFLSVLMPMSAVQEWREKKAHKGTGLRNPLLIAVQRPDTHTAGSLLFFHYAFYVAIPTKWQSTSNSVFL